MAFDAFLQIKDVPGESTDADFKGAIEILSFSWGASNPVVIGSSSTGGGAGKVSISSFNIMKHTDSASGELFAHCAAGTHFDKATITLRKSGGKKALDYLKYEFEEVFVESIQWSGSSGGDDRPSESVSLAFGKITATYTPQTAGGVAGKPIVQSWDVRSNTK